MAERPAAPRPSPEHPVRGLPLVDTVSVGLMSTGAIAGLWLVFRVGVGMYPGANVVIAAGIALALCAVALPFAWGMLGGSMPRSGGEYVFVSRIVHPAAGVVAGVAHLAIMVLWVFVLSPWAVDPGLVLMADVLDAPWLHDAGDGTFFGGLSRGGAVLLVATALNLSGLAVVIPGSRVWAPVQRIVVVVGLAGAGAVAVAFSLTDRESFIERWDELAAAHGSLDHEAFVAAAETATGALVPTTWTWHDTIASAGIVTAVLGSACYLVFVAGEARRPGRDLPRASLLAVGIPALLLVWVATAAATTVGFEFLSAAAMVDHAGGAPGYELPWRPDILALAWVAWPNTAAGLLIAVSFIAVCGWWIALTYLGFGRLLGALGLDRLGPRWFAAGGRGRRAVAVMPALLCFLLVEAAIAVAALWRADALSATTVIGYEVAFVWLTGAVAALAFPSAARARGFWETSPYHRRRALGLPLVTWGGLALLASSALSLFFLVTAPATRDDQWMAPLFAGGLLAAGILWYGFWSVWRVRTVDRWGGARNELPPD